MASELELRRALAASWRVTDEGGYEYDCASAYTSAMNRCADELEALPLGDDLPIMPPKDTPPTEEPPC